MCKVLLLGLHANYNLEHYVKINLEKAGYEVLFYGYGERLGRLTTPLRMLICRSKTLKNLSRIPLLNRINREIKWLAESFKPELVLTIKGEAVLPETMEWMRRKLNATTALWYPDDPRFFSSLVKHTAPSYDYVFTASEKAVPLYKAIGVENVHYLPFACEPTVHRRLELGEDCDARRMSTEVAFVGTWYPRRAKIIKALERRGFKVDVWGPYWKYFKHNGKIHSPVYGPEMIKVFNTAKIILNIHDEADLGFKTNMRTFEVTGSGAFLLTDKPCGLEKLFKIREEVVCYNHEGELVELVKHHLDNGEERTKISTRGQRRAYREHTYEDRVKQTLEKIRL